MKPYWHIGRTMLLSRMSDDLISHSNLSNLKIDENFNVDQMFY